MLKKTKTCGELRSRQAGQTVVLNGWLNRRRDHGGLIFIDLRDRYGMTQIVFDPHADQQVFQQAKKLGLEDVLAVKGLVRNRPEEAHNPEMATGTVEVLARELEILNEARPLPFMVTDRSSALEELRLKYRYLELRTAALQRTLGLRHLAAQQVREYYKNADFYEIETPFLMKSTPEGARDYIVPSRIHKGKFYALPQSPQTYKQLLMIAGFDKYFQLVKCFRDEDLRADRQPEFTQIDVEMSFVEEEDIMRSTEKMLGHVFNTTAGVNLAQPFARLSYHEALQRYGTDKPDLRYGYEIHSVNDLVEKTEFKVFTGMVAKQGTVAGLCVPQGDKFSRKVIDDLTAKVRNWGGKGLAYTKVTTAGLEKGIAKFLEPIADELIAEFEATPEDILFFIADETPRTYPLLGHLRIELAKLLDLIPTGEYFKPVWITRFPLLEWDADEQRYLATHHPFTAVDPEDEKRLPTEPEKVCARAYDIVINGYEVGGGSIRNHTLDQQLRMFKALNISEQEARNKFGFLLEALTYGAPPHGGIALGFDRLVMILAGVENIRDAIAFPKTTSAASLMDGSPSPVSAVQLKELGLTLRKTK